MSEHDYDVEDILNMIRETKEWRECDEKIMRLEALNSMLLSRFYQIKYKEVTYLEKEDIRMPSFFDKFFHLFRICCWLRYEKIDCLDGNRRICLICGKVETSIMSKDIIENIGYGYSQPYESAFNFKEFMEFIKEKSEGIK